MTETYDPFSDVLLERHAPSARFTWSVSVGTRSVLLTDSQEEASALATQKANEERRRLWLREPGKHDQLILR